MSKGNDRALGMKRPIKRRDFLNGVGVALTGSALAPGWLSAFERSSPGAINPQELYYPPALTGMRGSHEGSFEIAHAMRDGRSWEGQDTGERYDMIVVGAGLSGLSAAFFFLTSAGPGARVLLLDNHDDFGGHAKRNELTYEGRTLLLNGGTSNLESIDHYSTVARTLLRAVGVDIERAQAAGNTSRAFYNALGLQGSTFFSEEIFGEDRLVKGRPGRSRFSDVSWGDWLAGAPLSPEVQRDIGRGRSRIRREDADRVHERDGARLDSIHQPGDQRGHQPRDVPHGREPGPRHGHRGLQASPVRGRAHASAHDAHALRPGRAQEGAAPHWTPGPAHDLIRDLRAEEPRSDWPDTRRRWVRSGARHCRHHGKPLAPWICVQLQHAGRPHRVGAIRPGRSTVRDREAPLREDLDRELRRRGDPAHRRRDRRGASLG